MFIAVNTEPCALHDLWPCAICNGDLAKQEREERESRFDWAYPDDGTIVLLPAGTRYAEFAGHCARCGLNFGEGSPIRYDEAAQGWTAMGCCG